MVEAITRQQATEDQIRTVLRQQREEGIEDVRAATEEDFANLAKRLRRPKTWHNPRGAHEGGRKPADSSKGRK